jgi:hypothetical protein
VLEDPKGNINYVWNEFISGDAKPLMPTNKKLVEMPNTFTYPL